MTEHERAQTTAHSIAAEVAPFLPDGWTYDKPEPGSERERWWAACVGPNGERIVFHVGSTWAKPGQVNVSGNYPDDSRDVYVDDDEKAAFRKEVNVTIDRGYEVIGREITRRLLPEYVAAYTAVAERVREHKEGDAHTVAETARLAERFGGQAGTSRRGRHAVSLPHGDAGYGDVELWFGAEKVNIDMHSVPMDLAERIADVVREYRKQ